MAKHSEVLITATAQHPEPQLDACKITEAWIVESFQVNQSAALHEFVTGVHRCVLGATLGRPRVEICSYGQAEPTFPPAQLAEKVMMKPLLRKTAASHMVG